MTDRNTVAIHEIGHGIVQAILDIGPQWISIQHSSDNKWCGQSKLYSAFDNQDKEKMPQIYISEMAGPIAQCVASFYSIESVFDETTAHKFLENWLMPCFNCVISHNEIIAGLGWSSDMKAAIYAERQQLAIRLSKPEQKHRLGGFLFECESILYQAFKSLKDDVLKVAELLQAQPLQNNEHRLEREPFLEAAAHIISAPAWQSLRDMDLDFPLTNGSKL